MMGFPVSKPLHSPAVEKPSDKPIRANAAAHKAEGKPLASSARSPDMKTKPKIATQPVHAPKKSGATAKKAADLKPKLKGKPNAHVTAKAQGKAVARVMDKAPPPSKPKAAAQPAKSTPATTPRVRANAKAPTPAPAPAKVAVKAPPKELPMATKLAVKTLAAAAPAVAAPPPVKPPRPSSRLAQLTVPSMAQSVASTAAKASYSQSEPTAVVSPVIPATVKKDPKLLNNWKSKAPTELTDQELTSMPDSEYMNDVQLAAFRAKLVNLKTGILSNAGQTTEHLREDTSVVPDPADRATIEEEHALELRTRDRERKLLKKIEQSIARIDAGDYGYCDETGEPIGVGRLLARPTATLSLEAQQRRELKQKMFGD